MKKNVISKVEAKSIAEELGIEVGDTLLSINEKEVIDIIDYLYLITDEDIFIEIQKPDGEIWEMDIEKEYGEELGVEFSNPLMDHARSCSNNCLFCFIDQLPEGMRETLYFKDDDSRLSFLQGNFVTLTNVTDEQLDRIIQYRISPINVSVHTTNPDLRADMLNNRFAGNVLERLKKLVDGGIKVNGQIVLCPNINDGKELDRTLSDLSTLSDNFFSVAIVPIGLTKFRQGLRKVEGFDQKSAKAVIDQLATWQEKFLHDRGTRFAFLSDEFYVVAKEPLPDDAFYEDYAQIENGVGLLRRLQNELDLALESVREPKVSEVTIATGTAAYEYMVNLADMIMAVHPVKINVKSIINRYFGEKITVAGLLTAQDIKEQLIGNLGDRILLTDAMFKADEDVLLDDVSIDELSDAMGVTCIKSPSNGEGFLRSVLGLEE